MRPQRLLKENFLTLLNAEFSRFDTFTGPLHTYNWDKRIRAETQQLK
jgi:hypothetical protein